MELASLSVTIDARRAREEVKALGTELLATADKADKVSQQGFKAVSNLATAAKIANPAIAATRKEMEQAEKETLAWAQATARLQVAEGNLAGAVNTLKFALQGANAQTTQAINAQTQLATVQNRLRGGGVGIGGGANPASFNATSTAAGNLLGRLLQLTVAYLSLRGAMHVAEELIDAQIAMQRLEQTLSITTGSIQGAREQMSGLRADAERIGTSFIDSATAFAKFQAATEGTNISAKTIHDTFIAVSEASTRLHLTNDETRGVFLALEQMVSKGTVSMEELRRQLGNYLPGALSISARAMGVTTRELMEMVKAGELLTEDFLPKFAAQLSKDIPLGDASNSLSAEINRIKNAWLELKAVIAEGIDFKTAIQGGSAFLNEQRLRIEANRMRESAGSAYDNVPHRNIYLEMFAPSKQRENQIAANQANVNERLDQLLNEKFPFSTNESYAKGNRSFEEVYMQRAMSAEQDKANFFRLNPVQGPPIPPTVGRSEADNARGDKLFEDLFKADAQEAAEALRKQNEELERQKKLITEGDKLWESFWKDDAEDAAEVAEALRKLSESYVGRIEGEESLIGATQRRLDLERQLLSIDQSTKGGSDAAKKMQDELERQRRGVEISLRDNTDPAGAFIHGWEEASAKFGTISQQLAATGEKMNTAITDGLAGALTDAIFEAKSFEEAFSQMARSVVKEMTQIILKQLILNSLKGITSLFGGGSGVDSELGSVASAHSGGMVGDGGFNRDVSAMMFAGARRYHSGGVVGDEVPIIARRGEGVATPEQLASIAKGLSGGKQAQKVEIINVTDPRMIDEYLAANPNAVLNILNRNKAVIRRLIQ